MLMGATDDTPKDSCCIFGVYSAVSPLTNLSRYAVMSSPRYVDITAGGASHAPRRKSFPGLAMAMRMRSPCLSMPETRAAMMTGKASGLPVASLSALGFRSCTPSLVARDQLLCLPLPLIPAKGFSCRRHARPFLAATSSEICITIRFWSVCTGAGPKSGANSYWFGATSRWRVFRGMPILKHSSWISCMHLMAGVALESGAM
mmetsp:Transcript_53689/g.141530  ORF Transcript_53689/g.141530 Transcript_53689/m.141530 type:complete len:203 (+) Transcript_53689:562-1170(+)